MVVLALACDTRLFTDKRGEPYIRLWRGEEQVTLRLRSREVKAWLAGLLWKAEQKVPSSRAVNEARNILVGIAYASKLINGRGARGD